MLAETREDIRQIISGQTNLKGMQLDRFFDSAARRIATYCLPHHLKWITEIPITISTTDSQRYVAITSGISNISAIHKDHHPIKIVGPDEFSFHKAEDGSATSAHPNYALVVQERIYFTPMPSGVGDITVIASIDPTYLDDASPISGVLDSMPDFYDSAMKWAILTEHSVGDVVKAGYYDGHFERAVLRCIEASKDRGQAIGQQVPSYIERDFGAMAPGGEAVFADHTWVTGR